MNEYERKFDAAMQELANTKIWMSNYAPPLMNLQRRLGWLVRPPHYAPIWRIVLGYALWFGPIWGLMMWFAQWRAQGHSVTAAIAFAAISGLLFGTFMALYYTWSRRRYRLSRWEDL